MQKCSVEAQLAQKVARMCLEAVRVNGKQEHCNVLWWCFCAGNVVRGLDSISEPLEPFKGDFAFGQG